MGLSPLMTWFLAGIGFALVTLVALLLFGRWYVAEGRRRFPEQETPFPSRGCGTPGPDRGGERADSA